MQRLCLPRSMFPALGMFSAYRRYARYAVRPVKAGNHRAGPDDPFLELRRVPPVIRRVQSGRLRRGPFHQVGESDARFQERGVVLRPHVATDQSRRGNRGPETVPRIREIVADANRVRGWVDARSARCPARRAGNLAAFRARRRSPRQSFLGPNSKAAAFPPATASIS